MGLEEFLLDRAEKQGIEKGAKEEKVKKNIAFTQSLLKHTNFSIEKIADLVGVSEDFVTEVKSKMEF
ncbi:hypothetical protein [Dyadobacter sp. CY312]|uniref:hypothetical protein n=1 Tax=Dyadobacter sp. CY312 TaxID=2907303 RepID=UPI001F3DAA50|nr:hypothetical protein [Dyadobacter sp. CY312]MCE7040847.1 hypothetical protein [Dyadobacter sp. CY312]